MKKLVIGMAVVATMAFMSLPASASIAVGWSSSGLYNNPGSWVAGPWPSTAGLRQLIWSDVDPIVNNLKPTADAGNNYLSATHEWQLATYAPGGADDYAFWFALPAQEFTDANVGGNPITNGWLYSRIFQDATPNINDWYYQSVALAPVLQTYDSSAPGTVILYNSADGGPYQLNAQVVPEPATWAFMGIGALVVAIRRMRKA